MEMRRREGDLKGRHPSKRAGELVVLLVASAVARNASGENASPPPGWIEALPTVEAVLKEMPTGRSPNETAIRRSAAFEVLEDLIRVFTGKDVSGLSQMPPKVETRYREYDKADNFFPKKDVWNLALTKDFREEVLAKTVSTAAQQAYWRVRTATMASEAQKRDTGTKIRASLLWTAAQLPSVETVRRDMKGAGDRDTAARTEAALHWLAVLSERLPEGRPKSVEYGQARSELRRRQPQSCADEPGCDATVTGALSRLYWCRSTYEGSPQFVRFLLDKYVPAARQADLKQIASVGSDWDKALAMPIGIGGAGAGGSFVPPTLACTTAGQFAQGDDAAAKAKADLAARARERRRARAAFDAEARTFALADGRTAKGHVNLEAFGLPLGSVLTLPDCEDVGHWGKTLVEVFLVDAKAHGSVMVSGKTCFLFDSDGSATIHWGDGALPKWVSSVTTVIRGDVLVSVKIDLTAVLPPPATYVVGSASVVAQAQAYAAYYNAGAWKQGPENVAAAHEALKKYGPPWRIYKETIASRTVEEPEWRFDGLHVKYNADAFTDTILIELESVFKARTDAQQGEKTAEPKL
jgi:hypothetical protein